jgi:hypothetical protein
MHSLPVWQQDHSKVSPLHFFDSNPSLDASVGLDMLTFRRVNGALNPFILDYCPIRPHPDRLKVFRCFHNTASLPNRHALMSLFATLLPLRSDGILMRFSHTET